MQQKMTKKSLFKQFARNARGGIAAPASIAFLAIILSAGAAVDYSRISHTKTIVADALDAALLAAAKDLSTGAVSANDLEGKFSNFFLANVELRSKQTDVFVVKEFDADPNTGIVSATVEADLKMSFMGIVGKDRVKIPLASEVRYKTDEIELAMMLDVTGSMQTNGKLNSLKKAAADAVDILIPVGGNPNGKVRIGMVPYSYAVNAGIYAKTVNNKFGGNTNPGGYSVPKGVNTKNCLVERAGVNVFTDVGYLTAPIPTDVRAGCPETAIRPLTDDRDALIADLKSLKANGYTAGHMGVAWTYYMLSENWRDLWPSDSKPNDYSPNVQKIAILMTDGIFNTYYQGTEGTPYVDSGFPQVNPYKASPATAIGLCDHMKQDKGGDPGIIVYSIAFDAPKDAQQTLKDCATPDTAETKYYHSAKTEEELRAVFQQIAFNIQKLRISK
ncbi:MAG: pilus assembly protein TadG-related protein [Rhizobiaceae bacterium]